MGSEPPTLEALPPELILSIAEFLDSDDLTCFSLCSRQLFTFLQTQRRRRRTHYENAMPFEDDHVRTSIVKRLERDLPNYFACHTCIILHRCDDSNCFGLTGPNFLRTSQLPCLGTLPEWPWSKGMGLRLFPGLYTVSGFDFCFTHLQLAMKRLYQGSQAGISTEALSYTEFQPYESKPVWPRPRVWAPREVRLFSLEAQICASPPNLCLRTQEIVRSPRGLKSDLFLDSAHNPLQSLFFCAHVSKHGFWKSVGITDAKPVVDEKVTSFARKCRRCNTDFQVDITSIFCDLVLVVTRWFNLGPGLTPNDPQWSRHSAEAWCVFNDPDLPDREYTAVEEFDVRSFFENASQRSFEDLRSYNLALFRNKHYKRVMRKAPAPREFWYMAHECARTPDLKSDRENGKASEE